MDTICSFPKWLAGWQPFLRIHACSPGCLHAFSIQGCLHACDRTGFSVSQLFTALCFWNGQQATRRVTTVGIPNAKTRSKSSQFSLGVVWQATMTPRSRGSRQEPTCSCSFSSAVSPLHCGWTGTAVGKNSERSEQARRRPRADSSCYINGGQTQETGNSQILNCTCRWRGNLCSCSHLRVVPTNQKARGVGRNQ